MKIELSLSLILLLAVCMPLCGTVAGNETQEFTISGFVYDSEGNPAESTSIRVDSMPSVWSNNGEYTVTGISEGQHTIRAYFMNNGHSVVYRQIYVNQNIELDWHEMKNWITAHALDASGEALGDVQGSSIELVESGVTTTLVESRAEFGPLSIGEYYTIKANIGPEETNTQFVRMKLQQGSLTETHINHFELLQGHNSRYGYVLDQLGNPIQNVQLSTENTSSTTNSDGFYLLENLIVDTVYNVTVQQAGVEIIPSFNETVTFGEGWLNLTSNVELIFPENVSFTTQVQAIQQSPLTIEWEGGEYTDRFSLYMNGMLVYNHTDPYYTFSPQSAGSYEFTIEAVNLNGSTASPQPLLIMVLPESSSSDLWSTGMNWDYEVTHTPLSAHGTHSVTITTLGQEVIYDAFERQREVYLTRVYDEHASDGEKLYKWYDSETLLPVRTYWVDAPSESSYFQEGTFGWNFTTNEGLESSPLDDVISQDLHFNRTNVIGVPGHPNGYDDTYNSVTITENVNVSTPAGNFTTTHISIIDNNDEVISWEYWYNSTVRNYVKIIDRLPGSHSDSVSYVLTDFEVPTQPQFIIDEYTMDNKNYNIDWGEFQGAVSYQLYEDGVEIYSGSETSFELKNQLDGTYSYRLVAKLPSGTAMESEEYVISLVHIVLPPEFNPVQTNVTEGEDVQLSWEPVENALWYSLSLQNENDDAEIIYNGSEPLYKLEDIETGRNRLRVNAGTSDGKISEWSPSMFIMAEEKDEDSVLGGFEGTLLGLGIGAAMVVFSLINPNSRRRSDESE